MNKTARVYIFGWPGAVGGASTKLAHLLRLLHRRFPIVLVPNERDDLENAHWNRFIDALEVQSCIFEELPNRLEGWGLALCNFEFLLSPKWAEVRSRGLKMTWSNEMMWTHPGELGRIFTGLVDQVLYVSAVQRACLEPQFYQAWTGSLHAPPLSKSSEALSGEIKYNSSVLRWSMTGNYIDPALFAEKERRLKSPEEPLAIGRLSRADPGKFPDDFPSFYEGLGVRRAKFRVMAWNNDLSARWCTHDFDDRWELLPAMHEDPSQFLRSLDLFVYSLRTDFRESWGRSIVEAMLSGVVPLLPESTDHHLRNLVKHGESGFLCRNAKEFGYYAQMLDNDRKLLFDCSCRAREDAVNRLCVADEHLLSWERAFPEL